MGQKGWLIQLDKCIGCDSCSIACKSENNTRPVSSPLPFKNGRRFLPDHVSYRWVVKKEGGVYPNPSLTFVTCACNHCQHPACMASCPVSDANNPSNESNAIFKRAADGIVLINQDVCIGCKSCIQSCPYGAPQFNSKTGKVEKCTFCVHRQEAGFLPACVTTCVGNAIQLVENFNVNESGMNRPEGFSDPSLTVPSVKFETPI
ncbi:MAG: 4Fe-4S dicluster domain-containing protein [Deltaproteobacteria bacterium]